MTRDERVGWHEFEQTPGDSEGQRSLVCCSLGGSQRVGHNLVTEQQPILVRFLNRKQKG